MRVVLIVLVVLFRGHVICNFRHTVVLSINGSVWLFESLQEHCRQKYVEKIERIDDLYPYSIVFGDQC